MLVCDVPALLHYSYPEAFVEKLAAEVSERMRRLKTKGRTLTLKILRAVANAPDGYMKGSIGHGVCDHLTRSFTLSSATDAARALQGTQKREGGGKGGRMRDTDTRVHSIFSCLVL